MEEHKHIQEIDQHKTNKQPKQETKQQIKKLTNNQQTKQTH